MLVSHPDPGMLLLHRALDDLFDLDAQFTKRRRVAIVTGDPLGRRLSGPGIRALELARLLAREHDVRLASTGPVDLQVESTWSRPSPTAGEDPRAVGRRDRVPRVPVARAPVAGPVAKVIVVDLYDPFHLEQLEQSRNTGAGRQGAGGREHHPGAQRPGRPRRLLHVRQRQTARPLAGPPGGRGAPEPVHLRQRRVDELADRRRAVRPARRSADPHRAPSAA